MTYEDFCQSPMKSATKEPAHTARFLREQFGLDSGAAGAFVRLMWMFERNPEHTVKHFMALNRYARDNNYLPDEFKPR